jgi:ATP-dependent exoDNAse (exonuclease V) beta subunit
LAYAHEHEEKAATLIQIQAILKDGCPPEEIAVIVRTNKEVEAWTRFLEANNLKVESRLKSNIFASSYVSLLLDLLLVMHDPSQKELELISVLRSGLLPIRRADILEISRKLYSANYKRAVRMTFFDALREEGFIKNTELIDKKAIVEFRDLIQELSLAPQEPFVRYVRMLLDRIGFLAFVEKE